MKKSKRKMRKIKKRNTLLGRVENFRKKEEKVENDLEEIRNVDEDIITIDNGAIEDLRVDSNKEIEDLIDYSEEEKMMVELEEEGTLLAEFQKERTDAIVEMFANGVKGYNRFADGIYPTEQFFARLDNAVKNIIQEFQIQENCLEFDYLNKIKNLKVQRNILIALFFLLLFLLVN